jgi:hypothetical protein
MLERFELVSKAFQTNDHVRKKEKDESYCIQK